MGVLHTTGKGFGWLHTAVGAFVALFSTHLLGCGDKPAPTDSIHFKTVDVGLVDLDNGGVAVVSKGDTLLSLLIERWRHGRKGAVSITYDAVYGTDPAHRVAGEAVLSRGLRMDIEVVSSFFEGTALARWIQYYRDVLMPEGFRFFGHGHTHALHDTMNFDQAFASFDTNFRLMQQWGLQPKAYAYPGSSGQRRSTQAANKAAGFICARGSQVDTDSVYIAAEGDTTMPEWYFLPSVVMGNASYRYLDTHDKLRPILNGVVERGAWVILMYHAIGIPEGWSYYPMDEFTKDLDAIADLDLWSANMDAAACYLKERLAASFLLNGLVTDGDVVNLSLALEDGLPDGIYDVPLTVTLSSPYSMQLRGGPPQGVATVDMKPDGSDLEVTVLTR